MALYIRFPNISTALGHVFNGCYKDLMFRLHLFLALTCSLGIAHCRCICFIHYVQLGNIGMFPAAVSARLRPKFGAN